jgi:hypothetical protein
MGLFEQYAGKELRYPDGMTFFIEPSIYPRIQFDEERAADFAEILSSGEQPFPPVQLTRESGDDGRVVVLDGVHRIIASILASTPVPYELVATPESLYAESVRLSAISSKPLTRAEKRTAVLRLLKEHLEWSNRKIAELAGVSHTFVANLRDGNVATQAAGDAAYTEQSRKPTHIERSVRSLLAATDVGEGRGLLGRDRRVQTVRAILEEYREEDRSEVAAILGDWGTVLQAATKAYTSA